MLALVAEQRAKSAARLAELLEARGLSQEALAQEAGVSVKTVSRWKNQRHDPDRATIKKVAKALDVEPGYLWEPPASLGLDGRDPWTTRLERIEALVLALAEEAGLNVEAILAELDLASEESTDADG